jgi:hypothetical protein
VAASEAPQDRPRTFEESRHDHHIPLQPMRELYNPTRILPGYEMSLDVSCPGASPPRARGPSISFGIRANCTKVVRSSWLVRLAIELGHERRSSDFVSYEQKRLIQ